MGIACHEIVANQRLLRKARPTLSRHRTQVVLNELNRHGHLGTPLLFGGLRTKLGFYAGVILYFPVSVKRRSGVQMPAR